MPLGGWAGRERNGEVAAPFFTDVCMYSVINDFLSMIDEKSVISSSTR